jgi:hypothetical protein
MALPIKKTPILKGHDAVRFIKRMRDNETRPITKKERAAYLRAKKTYDACVAAGHDRNFELPALQ